MTMALNLGFSGDLGDWLRGSGLEIVLYILGGMLIARFISYIGEKITTRIDNNYQHSDALVRTEAAKHRHALAQVITWVAVTIIYVLVTI